MADPGQPLLGLSLLSSSHREGHAFRSRLRIRRYVNGEAVASVVPQPVSELKRKERTENLNAARARYLERTGGRQESHGLTRKAAANIKRAVRLIAHTCRYCAFVTLTYSDDYIPTDQEAKRQLDTWLKRLARQYGQEVPVVWVAEIQEDRASESGNQVIHFHLFIGCWVDKHWLNNSWSEVVAKASGIPGLRLLPNVKGGKAQHGSYKAKATSLYLAKGSSERQQEEGGIPEIRPIYGRRHSFNVQARELLKGREEVIEYADETEMETAFYEAMDNAAGVCFGEGFMLGHTWKADQLYQVLMAYALAREGDLKLSA